MNHILVWLEMVMQSGMWPSEAKNNICSLANFFFLQKIRPDQTVLGEKDLLHYLTHTLLCVTRNDTGRPRCQFQNVDSRKQQKYASCRGRVNIFGGSKREYKWNV